MKSSPALLWTYALLCVVGTLLPYGAFLPWLIENGLNIPALLSDIATQPVSLFAWLDVIVSAVALFVFIAVEGKRIGLHHRWLPVVATLSVGVSLGLPLFLWLRERHLAQHASA